MPSREKIMRWARMFLLGLAAGNLGLYGLRTIDRINYNAALIDVHAAVQEWLDRESWYLHARSERELVDAGIASIETLMIEIIAKGSQP